MATNKELAVQRLIESVNRHEGSKFPEGATEIMSAARAVAWYDKNEREEPLVRSGKELARQVPVHEQSFRDAFEK